MKVENVSLELIRPYDKNPRKNEKAVEKVAESLREFGFQQPIVVDKDGVIIAGHTRYKAARLLGLLEVPVVYALGLTDAQVKAYRLADNKTAEFAEWDMALLLDELKDLSDAKFDMARFGFDPEEPEADDDFDADAAYDAIKQPITVLGDIWKLGGHRLACGDSTDQAVVDRLMDGRKADLVLTDPPYNVDYEGGTKEKLQIQNDKMTEQAFRAFLTAAFQRMMEAAKPGSPIYVFHAGLEGHNFLGALREAGWNITQCLIWVKSSLVLGRQDYQWMHEPILYGWKKGAAHFYVDERANTTVIEDRPDFGRMKKDELLAACKDLYEERYKGTSVIHEDKPLANTEHPTMKPVRLCARLMANSSKPKACVLDLFGGSGSTLIAAEQLERACYTMELDPKYCDVIIKRWEEFTGRKAVREDGRG